MKKILTFVCLLLVCHLMLFAQARQPDPISSTTEESAIAVPAQNPAGLKVIYSNLGKAKTDLYWASAYSWILAGPNASTTEFIAMPFTPKSNAQVSQVQVAVLYNSGDNQVNLSIYADSGSDYPGTLLAGPVTVMNLPQAGTCCPLTVANFPALAVTAGTQYWVVGDTPLTGTGSDFSGVWNHVAKDIPISFYKGSHWFKDSADNLPAGEVLGTVP